ncbi:hypothetical protein AB4137_02945 [Vibrio breoganii]
MALTYNPTFDFPEKQEASRAGQLNGRGDPRALFMRKLSGNIINFTSTHSLARNIATVEKVSGAKGATFYNVGTKNAKFHKVGELLEDEANNLAENGAVTIDFDDYLYSHSFISELDDALFGKFKYNSAQAIENGNQLNRALDAYLLRTVANGASITTQAMAQNYASTKNISKAVDADQVLGQRKAMAVDMNDGERGTQLVKALMRARSNFTDTNPVAVVCPRAYMTLGEASGVLGMSYVELPYGVKGSNITVPCLQGMPIISSELLPTTKESTYIDDGRAPRPERATTTTPSNTDLYTGEFTGLLGVVFSKDAVGMAINGEVQTDLVEEPFRCGYNIVSKVLVGFGVLRPDRIVAISEKGSMHYNAFSSADIQDMDTTMKSVKEVLA